MKTTAVLLAATAMALAGAATAQVVPSLPAPGSVLRPLGGVLDPARGVLDPARGVLDPARGALDDAGDALERARLDRIAALVRAHPDRIVRDPEGFAARVGEVLVSEPDAGLIAAADARGLRLIERGETLGVGYARFALPPGVSLKAGIALLRRLGASDVSANPLYVASGTGGTSAPPVGGRGVRIGMIDGGVAGGTAQQRGFAAGAPRASDHGTAIASLIAGSGRVAGAAPGSRILAADVYGSDPAGGSADAIVRALGWLAGERVAVITISLVGPPNPLLARVVAAAQARGTVIVAAVGNDGPAAPPSYPASYPGVVAVTAVDGRKRVLIEAGHATHLDYAAPGADMLAASAGGAATPVRGTSFAAPLVAATIALAYPVPDPARRAAALARVDAAAERRDRRYGRGIVCGACATAVR